MFVERHRDDTNKHISNMETDKPRNTNNIIPNKFKNGDSSKVKVEVITCELCKTEINEYKKAPDENHKLTNLGDPDLRKMFLT